MQTTIDQPKTLYSPALRALARRSFRAAVLLALGGAASLATAGPVRSVGAMQFVDADTLVIVDWRGGEFHALHLPPAASATPKSFNAKNAPGAIARALRTRANRLHFEDLAFRPGSELAYLTISVGRPGSVVRPALIALNPAGRVEVVDLRKTPQASIAIKDVPWNVVPQRTDTLMDLVYHESKPQAPEVSNASLRSTPGVQSSFAGATVTGGGLYRAIRVEFAPSAHIRASLTGEPAPVAGYNCTPRVTIPLTELKNVAQAEGRAPMTSATAKAT